MVRKLTFAGALLTAVTLAAAGAQAQGGPGGPERNVPDQVSPTGAAPKTSGPGGPERTIPDQVAPTGPAQKTETPDADKSPSERVRTDK
jgi:hypothetical protein